MSNTVTARRNRYEFLLTQLSSTNLFCRQLLLEIYTKQDDGKSSREALVRIRNDIEKTETFRHELLIKFPFFECVFRQCSESFIALMYMDGSTLEMQDVLPGHFVFHHYLQLCFAKPILLEEDDKHGTFFMQFIQEWPTMIKTFLKCKQTYTLSSLNTIVQAQSRKFTAEEEDDDVSVAIPTKVCGPLRVEIKP
jgi:hypothetical protein